MTDEDFPDDDPAEALRAKILAAVANYRSPDDLARMAENPLLKIKPAVRVPVVDLIPGSGASEADTFDAVAELVERGLLDEWEVEGDAGVTLSTAMARHLGIRLSADSARWMEEERRKGAQVRATNVIVEADLDREEYGWLSDYSEEQARSRVREADPPPGPPHPTERERAIMAANEGNETKLPIPHRDAATFDDIRMFREDSGFRKATEPNERWLGDSKAPTDRMLLEIFAEAIDYTDWSMGENLPGDAVVLMGVPTWPLPGQSRMPAGPDATYGHPPAIPSDFEAGRGKGRPWLGPCWACGGARLYGRMTCDVCSRGAGDGRIKADLKLAIKASYRHGAGDGKAVEPPSDGKSGGTGHAPPGKVEAAETRKQRRAKEFGERKPA
jgi:hypothetical protein